MKTFLAVIRMCRVNVRLGASPPCNIVIAIGKTECQAALHQQLIGDASDTIELATPGR